MVDGVVLREKLASDATGAANVRATACRSCGSSGRARSFNASFSRELLCGLRVASFPGCPTIFAIAARHDRIDAARRPLIEEIALDPDIEISARERQLHDLLQCVLDGAIGMDTQTDPGFESQSQPPK